MSAVKNPVPPVPDLVPGLVPAGVRAHLAERPEPQTAGPEWVVRKPATTDDSADDKENQCGLLSKSAATPVPVRQWADVTGPGVGPCSDEEVEGAVVSDDSEAECSEEPASQVQPESAPDPPTADTDSSVVTDPQSPVLGGRRVSSRVARASLPAPQPTDDPIPPREKVSASRRSMCAVKRSTDESPSRWTVGDIVWVFVAGYPMWPAIISFDPIQGQFTKVTYRHFRTYVSHQRRYHVRFFGDRCRCWSSENQMREFAGRHQFEHWASVSRASAAATTPSSLARISVQFRVSPRHLERWNSGVEEAGRMLAMTRADRIKSLWEKGQVCDPTASPQPPAEEPSTPEPTLNRRRSESGARSGSKRRRSEMGARSGSKRRRNKSTVRPSRRSSPSQRVSAEAREVKPSSRGPVVNRDNESRDSASRDASTRSASTRLDSIDSDDTVSESSTSRARAKKPDRACQVCLQSSTDKGTVIRCAAGCGSHYHRHCVGAPDTAEVCANCQSGRRPCFVCGSAEPGASGEVVEPCQYRPHCGRRYHRSCLRLFPQALLSDQRPLICPLHTCHTCVSDNPQLLASQMRLSERQIYKCVLCPTSYHTSERCLAAGTEILSSSQIVCTKHPNGATSRSRHCLSHVNANWCFICSKGGSLVCCEVCPASFHVECINVPIPEGGYICEQCETGRFPLYGEVVWAKIGAYRWWPSLVVPPNNIPVNLMDMPCQRGDFVVRFFGSNDYSWVSRGRVFVYEQEDSAAKILNYGSRQLSLQFKKAIADASEYFRESQLKKISIREAVIGMKPPSYVKLRTNRPVGGVKLLNSDATPTTACDCSAHDAHPCGPDSSCINRMLMFECDADVCPAGDQCENRRFQRRSYPPLEPFLTEHRGWGLRSTANINKGDFVIEYVGEVISEAEMRRRAEQQRKVKDDNYYFLTIDKDRILDAGPKGNLARFMNHSCEPNCETQKWTINAETRVGLFAIEDISAGTELKFNYNFDCVGEAKKQCLCGAANCSGFIGDKVVKSVSSKDDRISIKQKKRKKRRLRPASEDECFRCSLHGQLVLCDSSGCPKAYHLDCLQLDRLPHGKWMCPWHHCDVCGQRAVQFCRYCPNSLCKHHNNTSISTHFLLGDICDEHSISQVQQLIKQRQSQSAGNTKSGGNSKASSKESSNSNEKSSTPTESEPDTTTVQSANSVKPTEKLAVKRSADDAGLTLSTETVCKKRCFTPDG